MSLQKIYERKPLIHCITNYVVANFTANGLLAIGASPVMADAEAEVVEMARQADALLLNIGTLNERTVRAMQLAGKSANMYHVPVVLDPVGAGATTYRTQTVKALLAQIRVQLIRCNVGELAAIAGIDWRSKGVDSGEGTMDVIETAQQVAKRYECFVIVTGETDVMTDGDSVETISGGHINMTRITGSGCLLSAICAAVLASSTTPFDDLVAVLAEYKRIGERAVQPLGTFQIELLNQLAQFAEVAQ